MSRRPARFTEADLRRAVKVAREADMAVEVTPEGAIRLMSVPPAATVKLPDPAIPQRRPVL